MAIKLTSSILHMYHMNRLLVRVSIMFNKRACIQSIPIGNKSVGDLQHVLFAHILPLSSALCLKLAYILTNIRCHASLNTQIASRKDICSLQGEAGEHLNTPSTQPSDGNQLFQQLFVAGLYKALEHSILQKQTSRQDLECILLFSGRVRPFAGSQCLQRQPQMDSESDYPLAKLTEGIIQ